MNYGQMETIPNENIKLKTVKQYSPSEANVDEGNNKHEYEKKEVRNNMPWSKPMYDTEKYNSYPDFLMGIEKNQIPINNELFNRSNTISWGELQKGFPRVAHELTVEQLSDSVGNDLATKRIKNLSKKKRSTVEGLYKMTNKTFFSDDDNIEQRVNNAFLKNEGLEDVIINGKKYKGLLFDENSKQSKKLKNNKTFKTYFNNYLFNMKDIINKMGNSKEFDVEAISETLKTNLGKPDFSTNENAILYDYYPLMGGTQNVTVDFEISPVSEKECNLTTKMYINDWYGADKDDINGSRGTLKGNMPGLKDFFICNTTMAANLFLLKSYINLKIK
ncbi:MAG: hypothetical protein R3Y26_10290 [Rikenellaceae bacterium]